MADKFFPDKGEPHVHEHNGGITFTSAKHAHTDLMAGNVLREEGCKKVIDDLKSGASARELKIIDYIKTLVRKEKKGK